ncbi:TPA: hypothetical protein KD875_003521 [Vibrio cholerae]|nr:hypothetical protein [Vibrio cholerae]
MSDLEISYWSMIGTWFAGIATFLAVVVSLYLSMTSRRTRLLIRIRDDLDGEYKLILLNRSQLYAEMESVNLCIRRGFILKDVYSSRWSDLVRDFFKSEEDGKENMKLYPNNTSRTFSVDMSTLSSQYSYFLPYDNDGVLASPIKMPHCCIQVRLVSGEVFYHKLPSSFYDKYREYVGSRHDHYMDYLSNEPWKYIHYGSSQDLLRIQKEHLDIYTKTRINYHMLLC